MQEVASDKKKDWGLAAVLIGVAWYLWGRNGNNGPPPNGIAQFRGLSVNYAGTPGSPITVYADDNWGGTLRFEHRGAGRKVWVGIGFAVGSGIPYIHNNYFTYIPVEVTVTDHADWTPYEVQVQRLVGYLGGANYPDQNLDCHRFISNSLPPAGGQAPDDYGLNNWDDDVYIVRERIVATTFRELSVEYLGANGEGLLTTWSFDRAGLFDRSLPSSFTGSLLLNNLNAPSQVTTVWDMTASPYISWDRSSGGGELQSIVAGRVYRIATIDACNWPIYAPSGTMSTLSNLELCYI